MLTIIAFMKNNIDFFVHFQENMSMKYVIDKEGTHNAVLIFHRHVLNSFFVIIVGYFRLERS